MFTQYFCCVGVLIGDRQLQRRRTTTSDFEAYLVKAALGINRCMVCDK